MVAAEGEHAVGGAQSAIEPQWFCDELGLGLVAGVIYYFILRILD
jgi:hypothetical protein